MNNIPAGFLFDPVSGWYYQESPGVDANGTPVRKVTWFDPNTGNLVDSVYPVEEATAPADSSTEALDQTAAIPVVEESNDITPPTNEPMELPEEQPVTAIPVVEETVVEPQPIPQSEPQPEPQPIPQPEPQPIPQPEPQPIPQPEPQPIPQPEPQPIPQPEPQPIPQPEPIAQPQAGSYQPPQAGSYQPPQAGSYQPPQAGSYQQPQAGSYQQPQAGSYQAPQAAVPPTTQKKKGGKGCIIAAAIVGGLVLLGGIGIAILVMFILPPFMEGVEDGYNAAMEEVTSPDSSGLDDLFGGSFDDSIINGDSTEPAPEVPTDSVDSSTGSTVDGMIAQIYPYDYDTGEYAIYISGFPEQPLSRDYSGLMADAFSDDLVYDVSFIAGDQMYAISLWGDASMGEDGTYELQTALWVYNPETDLFDYTIDLLVEPYGSDAILFVVPYEYAEELLGSSDYSIEVREGDDFDDKYFSIDSDLFFIE